jgi:hypothetical protein
MREIADAGGEQADTERARTAANARTKLRRSLRDGRGIARPEESLAGHSL